MVNQTVANATAKRLDSSIFERKLIMYFRRNTKLRNHLSCPKVGHFTLINSAIFKQKKYLKSTKLYRAQSGRGLRRRAGPKKGVTWDSGTPFSSPMTNPVLSCLFLSSGLSFGVPADRSKTVLFMPEKWAWPSKKGACQGGIKGARCPTPCHAPLGSLGGDLGPFLAGKSPFFADFRHSFFGFSVPRQWAWPSEGAWRDAPPPMGPLGGLCPVGFTGF